MRCLYVVCYDVADPARLRRVHRLVKAWAVGGQKSCYECWMTPAEREQLLARAHALLDPTEDRMHLFQLDPRMEVRYFGAAQCAQTAPFLVV